MAKTPRIGDIEERLEKIEEWISSFPSIGKKKTTKKKTSKKKTTKKKISKKKGK